MLLVVYVLFLILALVKNIHIHWPCKKYVAIAPLALLEPNLLLCVVLINHGNSLTDYMLLSSLWLRTSFNKGTLMGSQMMRWCDNGVEIVLSVSKKITVTTGEGTDTCPWTIAWYLISVMGSLLWQRHYWLLLVFLP
jgi:hypothetical protein